MSKKIELEMDIVPIFPQPLAVTKFPRRFTKAEAKFFSYNLDDENLRPNTGNRTSRNNNILDAPEMRDIRAFIEAALDGFIKMYDPPENPNIRTRITQSWLNICRNGEFHHPHKHPNSVISGVLYISAEKSVDSIKFLRPEDISNFYYPPAAPTAYNSREWKVSVETYDLVMFKSTLQHVVSPLEDGRPGPGNENRISLSFNTFYVGEMGDPYELTGLILP